MMSQASCRITGLDEGDLINPDDLSTVFQESLSTESSLFTLSGSLLDYAIDDFAKLLRFQRSGSDIDYKLSIDLGEEIEEGNKRNEKNRIKDSFLRAGVADHANISRVIDRLRQYDDVVIGVDTNVLWDCLITSQLLEKIYQAPYPNWILLAIPKLVMAETENAANITISSSSHPRSGFPTYKARLAQRGLQEIMTLRERDPDRPGLAVMTVGELDAEYDEVDRHNWKLDSQIRSQFLDFLNDISFHKGTFFLSQDRVNVMMSGTEGADGLYLQKPDLSDIETGSLSKNEFSVLTYELAVQFGGVRVEYIDGDSLEIDLDVFWPGKQVSDWRKSRLRVANIGTNQ